MRSTPANVLLLALASALSLLTGAPAPASQPRPAPSSRPDLVLITLDTFRWDAPGFAGIHTPSPTPNLDRLATAGRVFTDAHAHNVVTLPSHANLLTGLYPYQHGVRDNAGFRLPASIPTLATALHDAGYATAAFVAAYPLDSEFGLDRGFDVYDDRYPKGAGGSELNLPERRGDEVVTRALAWWRSAATVGKPRFLWVHLFDAHAPYAPPPPHAQRWSAQPYLGEVAAVDAYLAPLLTPFLEGRERRAAVVVTADHGEALGDHGEETHGVFAYEATLKVPLVLWGEGVPRGTDARPARHVDVFPTMMALAGVKAPAMQGVARPGRSLLTAWSGDAPATYFEALSASLNRGWAPLRGVLAERRKLVALPLAELYDLARDPGEKANLVDRERPSARQLEALLPPESAWPPPGGSAARATPSAEAAERLRSLGYAVGSAAPAASWGPQDDPKYLRELDRKIFVTLGLRERGEHEQAVRVARDLVTARPTMALGHSLLAQAQLDAGQRKEALATMAAAHERGVATPGLRVQLGLTLLEVGRPQSALEILEPLAASGEPRALDALALAQSDAGRADDAAATLARSLAVDPENPRAWQHRSLFALRASKWGEARDAARRALELDDRLPLAWNDLGAALFRLGDASGAFDAWSRAVAIDPALWDAQWNLGTQGAQLGRTAEARRALQTFVRGAPRDRYARDIERARALLQKLEGAG